MELASGEVVDTPHGTQPYCAIFRIDDEVLFEWPVNSVNEGQARIQEALTFLHMKILESRGMSSTVLH